MILLRTISLRIRHRYELFRARMSLRNISDHEWLGRMLGLMIFPAAIFGCGGVLATNMNNRVLTAMEGQDVFPTIKKRPPTAAP